MTMFMLLPVVFTGSRALIAYHSFPLYIGEQEFTIWKRAKGIAAFGLVFVFCFSVNCDMTCYLQK